MERSTSSPVQRSTASDPDNLAIMVWTDRKEYPLDQSARIFVKINQTNHSVSSNLIQKVNLEVRPVNSDNIEYRSALLVDARQEFGFSPTEPGSFNATVFTFADGSMESAFTIFKVVDLFHTQTAYMIYLSIGFLAALMLLIAIGIRNIAIDEILRFIFLSGMVGSILVGFLVSDKQFGIRSPIGIVIKSINKTNEWVLNIGGGPPNFSGIASYNTGLQIPIYVLVIGLVGGYLRYLYKTSRLMTDNELIKERRKIRKLLAQEDTRNIARRIAFYQSLKDIVLLFLSPLIAVAVWFLISQWRPIENSVYLIGLICFAASLLTVEIVNTMIRFTKGYLKEPEASKQEEEPTQANSLAEAEGDTEEKESP